MNSRIILVFTYSTDCHFRCITIKSCISPYFKVCSYLQRRSAAFQCTCDIFRPTTPLTLAFKRCSIS
ncbi:hypothetical protein Barb7_02936 [Bacteroidales bacterium Barb7]|nr:hypothetical protein Barb7_02936 [Bacteroidales bacterium Barb7]